MLDMTCFPDLNSYNLQLVTIHFQSVPSSQLQPVLVPCDLRLRNTMSFTSQGDGGAHLRRDRVRLGVHAGLQGGRDCWFAHTQKIHHIGCDSLLNCRRSQLALRKHILFFPRRCFKIRSSVFAAELCRCVTACSLTVNTEQKALLVLAC